MPDMSTFSMASTVAAVVGMALGAMLPALAMGRNTIQDTAGIFP